MGLQKKRCMEAYKEEKGKVKGCIYQSKNEVNEQFGRKIKIYYMRTYSRHLRVGARQRQGKTNLDIEGETSYSNPGSNFFFKGLNH